MELTAAVPDRSVISSSIPNESGIPGMATTTSNIAPAGLALLDADGTVLAATPGFLRVLGISQPVGRGLRELLGTLDDPAQVQAALDALGRGEAVDLEAWCWRDAAGPAAVCLVAAPLELQDRRAVSYCLVRDITDQRLAAEEHARAVSLHQAALKSVADGLLVVDTAGRVLSFNYRFIELWDIPPDLAASGRDADLLSAVLHQLVDPEGFLRRVGELYADPDASAFDEIHLRDGRIFERYTQPQRHGGHSVGRVWSFRDVTASRRAVEVLQESRDLLELLFSQSLDGFFFMMLDQPVLWDGNTDKEAALDYIFAHERITKANDAMLAQYNARVDQLIGRTPNELLAHDLPSARGRWRRFLDSGHLHLETDERTLDGRAITIEGEYICVYDREGRLLGHFGIQRDVTRRRHEENEILRSRQELRDLTARLQLVREEERTRIARDIHDELGQALTGLKMDLAWVGSRMPDRPALAERVHSAIVRIDGAMNTVRRIATDLRPSVLDDLGLVAAVEWQCREFEETTGIATRLEVDAAGPELAMSCATTVFRILQEGLTNVARHARANRVNVSLGISTEAVTLDVSDDGRGISEAALSSPKSLGLIGIRERAIACGGALVIRGARKQGTTLALTIPLRRTEGTVT